MEDMKKLLAALAEVKDDVDFEHETSLVEDGLIDSLDLTQIMLALDETFGVRIPAGDIAPENFNSAQAMLELVHKYRQS